MTRTAAIALLRILAMLAALALLFILARANERAAHDPTVPPAVQAECTPAHDHDCWIIDRHGEKFFI